MTVNPDANGNDRQNINGEWVRIRNTGTRAVSLHRWWFRDSTCAATRSPRARSSRPAAASRCTWATAATRATRSTRGQSKPPLDNPSGDDRAMGDGGYLFDPRGNLRHWVIYH